MPLSIFRFVSVIQQLEDGRDSEVFARGASASASVHVPAGSGHRAAVPKLALADVRVAAAGGLVRQGIRRPRVLPQGVPVPLCQGDRSGISPQCVKNTFEDDFSCFMTERGPAYP